MTATMGEGAAPRLGSLLAGTAMSMAIAAATAAGPAAAQQQQQAAPAAPAALPTLSVEGAGQAATDYKVDMPSMTKMTEPLLDTPQTVNVISQEVMEDQAVTTLRDALRNVSGVSISAGEGGFQGDGLTIRGFSARNDIFLDGMRDFGSYYRDPFNLQQVEVLKGPDSLMFGRGSTGGVVNQVSKLPTLRTFVNGDVTVGSGQMRRATADINAPIEGLGNGTALRLNLMGQDSQVVGRDVANSKRYGFAPTLTFGLGTDMRLTLAWLHQQADDIPDYGLPWLWGKPAQVRRENFYGFKGGDFLKTRADIGTATFAYDINKTFTLTNKLRYANYSRDGRITEPQVATSTKPGTALNTLNVTRNEITVNSTETNLDNQLDLTSRFQTGFVNHTLVTGIEAQRETSDPRRTAYTGVPTTNLVMPYFSQPFTFATSTTSSNVKTTTETVAAYAIETAHLGEQVDLIGGVRFDRMKTNYSQSVAPVANYSQTNNLFSWRAGAVYKPMPMGSVYLSAGNSYNPSAEALSLTASTYNLDPEETQTYELGSKWNFLNDQLALQGSIFRSEKTNARVPDPNNSALNVLQGKQRVDGIDISVTGRITEKWQVLAGYTYLDSAVVKSTRPAEVGRQLANTPANSFTLWSTYQLPWRVQVGGGANYIGTRYASTTPDAAGYYRTAPGYWTFSAMAKYDVTEKISLQLNATNLFDKYYYDQLHPNHVVPGAGRTVLLTTAFKF